MLFTRLFHKILFNFQKIKLKIPDPRLPVSQKALLQEDASTRGVPESRWGEALTEGRGRRGPRRGRGDAALPARGGRAPSRPPAEEPGPRGRVRGARQAFILGLSLHPSPTRKELRAGLQL